MDPANRTLACESRLWNRLSTAMGGHRTGRFGLPFRGHKTTMEVSHLTHSLPAMIRSFPPILLGILVLTAAPAAAQKVDFNRDVLPLLSDRCFKCHGPDKANREGGLRLDKRKGLFSKLESGKHAVIPGKSAASELFRRISSGDSGERMPPADSGKTLSKAEIAKIKKWIDSGAKWSGHWSFQKPVKVAPPKRIAGWRVNNPVDLFIHRRVQQAKLKPSPKADKETLIRRVTLDLTGLPPTPREVDDFLQDKSPAAYETVVNRLLASTRYGEHQARIWLDAARYADTHGLHLDNERQIWPYREWVIRAFNRNLPFDQFTIEQLAGDLLPKPTLDQRVATGFNRCNVTTSEGGSIDAEYYVRYAVDRVETTATVWMGLTAGCAACHDHKFDPLTQKEFYQLFSYFYSLTERAMDGNALLPPPAVKVPSPLQRVLESDLQKRVVNADKEVDSIVANLKYTDPLAGQKLGKLSQAERIWIDDSLPAGAKAQGGWRFVSGPKHPVYSGKKSMLRIGRGIHQHFFTGANPPLVIGENTRLFAYVYLDPKNPPKTLQLQFNDGTWEHRASWGADKAFRAGANNASNRLIGKLPEKGKWVRLEVAASAVGLRPGTKINGWAFTQVDGKAYWDKAGITTLSLSPKQRRSISFWEQYRRRTKQPALRKDLQSILNTPVAKRSDKQARKLTSYFLKNINPNSQRKFAAPLRKQAAARTALVSLRKSVPSSLIMQERAKPRQAYILERGQYTKPREKVQSRVPDWMAPPVAKAPANRLGLAKWLVSREHPLTARVTVNRIWQHYFGVGLVRTAEDFGVQGERPSHPELLDWLAVTFIDNGWDVKGFHKMLVMSATYQQSSVVERAKLARDPENRLLSHGPRFRLDAETIRDQALAISGLLVETMGGPSVKPYQPAGLWKPVGFGGSNTSVFRQDKGSKLYRRSMYTFWKRTSPPPSMEAFDAPNRETCQVRRARTNTPLQALVLMNDVQLIEAARKFGERIMKEGGKTLEQRLVFAFRSVTSRRPKPMELASMKRLFELNKQEFSSNPKKAAGLLSVGERPVDKTLNSAELGAWTMVAHLLLNLSESITKG